MPNFQHQRPQSFVQPKRLGPTLSYYKTMTENFSSNGIIDREVMNQIQGDMLAGRVRYALDSGNVVPGDVVEVVCTYNGEFHFGVVLSQIPGNLVKILAVDINGSGVVINRRSSDVRLVVRALYNKDLVKSITDSSDESLAWHLIFHLKSFVKASLSISQDMEPILDQVYANYCSRRTTRAIDLYHLTESALNSVTHGKLKEYGDKGRAVLPSQLFGAYLALVGKDYYFTRRENSSLFLTIPERSAEIIDTVMNGFEDQETFNSWCEELAKGAPNSLTKTRHPLHLVPFLQHYIIYPDPKLADPVSKIMSNLYPDRDTDSWLTAPSSVYKLLQDKQVYQKNQNPYLVVASGIAWLNTKSGDARGPLRRSGARAGGLAASDGVRTGNAAAISRQQVDQSFPRNH